MTQPAPLFAAMPARRSASPGVTLAQRDPYFEWRNPHDHRDVERELAALPPDYQESAGWIRANRPRGSLSLHGEALRFWLAPLSRAHALNALLTRGNRTLVQVQSDVVVPRDKLHQYLTRWGVDFRIRRRRVVVQDTTGHRAAGIVAAWHPPTATAEIRLREYDTIITGRYDRISDVYRCTEPIPHPSNGALLAAPAAARLIGITEARLKQLVPAAHRSRAGVHLYALTQLEAFTPRSSWRCTPAQARYDANPCAGCIFHDDHLGACGLGNTRPPDPRTCPDYRPEERP